MKSKLVFFAVWIIGALFLVSVDFATRPLEAWNFDGWDYPLLFFGCIFPVIPALPFLNKNLY